MLHHCSVAGAGAASVPLQFTATGTAAAVPSACHRLLGECGIDSLIPLQSVLSRTSTAVIETSARMLRTQQFVHNIYEYIQYVSCKDYYSSVKIYHQ